MLYTPTPFFITQKDLEMFKMIMRAWNDDGVVFLVQVLLVIFFTQVL